MLLFRTLRGVAGTDPAPWLQVQAAADMTPEPPPGGDGSHGRLSRYRRFSVPLRHSTTAAVRCVAVSPLVARPRACAGDAL